MKKILLIVLVALILTGTGLSGGALVAYGGEPLSLQQYREMVILYSNQIKISKQQTIASKERLKATNTGFYPSLSASADANYFLGSPMKLNIPGFALKDYSYSASATIQQNVYAGRSVRSQAEADKIQAQISQINEDLTLETVVYGAEVTYWALAASEQQLSITKHYVKIVTNLYDIVNERFKNGYVSRTDLLMVETRLNEAKLQEIAAMKLYEHSLQNLNNMVGQTLVVDYAVVDTIGTPNHLPAMSTLEFALQERPDFLISQKQVDYSNQMVRVSRSKFNPQFVVGVQGMWGTSNPNFTGENNLYGVAFASFRTTIFSWGQRRHTVAAAKAGAISQQYSLIEMKDQVSREFQNAQSSLLQSFKQSILAESNMKIAHENLELNTYSYNEGKLPILDVLSAQLSWIQSFTAAVSSNYQYKVAFADYRKAIGTISE